MDESILCDSGRPSPPKITGREYEPSLLAHWSYQYH
jgi:hypothetical protein